MIPGKRKQLQHSAAGGRNVVPANEPINPIEQRIFELLQEEGPQSCQAVADALGLNPFVVHGWMTTLLEENSILKAAGLYCVPEPGNGPAGGSVA